MDMRAMLAERIAQAAKSAFPEGDLTGIDILASLETPPDPQMGDCAFPCFRLSKALRMGPPQIAQKLASALPQDIARAETMGGYLNFYFNREGFAEGILKDIEASGGRYGASDEGNGKTVVLDYSSINIAKRFHIGHLSTTMIGNSLKRIFDYLGYRTVGVNHLGDWGTQFGKMICAYKLWGVKDEVEKGGVQALSDLYVRFHQEAEKNPALEDEGRAWFKKIEDGDPEALEIFNWFKEMTLKDAQKVYDLLGVKFDYYTGESFYCDKTGAVVEELKEKGLLVESDGAMIVSLEEYNLPPFLILKSDGATLYATRDLAAALYRMKTFHFDQSLYVVAYQQDLHFKQLFKVLEKMGYDWAKDHMKHVSFGMISYEGQTLSTRRGYVVYLEDLLARAQEKALGIINEKSPNLEDKETVARQVGVGAVVYSVLFNGRIKDIDFWWDRALNFDGETGPYVQYTFARCCAVLRKAPDIAAAPDYSALCDDEAQAVLRALSDFPGAIRDAASKYEPSMITRAVTDICKTFNKFYYERRILDDDAGAAKARLTLTKAVRDTVKAGLALIGLEAPERM